MIKVGITGQSGFIGTHLFNTLALYPEEFEMVPFRDEFFQDSQKLNQFVASCDAIVHLAAVNRHADPKVIYATNIQLVKKLIVALDHADNKPHVLYSSSIQEDNDNLYGRSKKEGRELLANWAVNHGCFYTGFIFPNIFGPFGNPYFNSFIATFCYQLNHNENPVIVLDKVVPLLYVAEAVKVIIDAISEKKNATECRIHHTAESNVSEILKYLQSYKSTYVENGIIPSLNNPFEVNLFNTFRCYMDIRNHFPLEHVQQKDNRGTFVEIIRSKGRGQASFSTTNPGITRGNHFHTRKIERFSIVKGEALIQLRRIGTREVLNFNLSGAKPAFIDMPIWYTHNITNMGTYELYTTFWSNEFFNPEDPDTFFEKV